MRSILEKAIVHHLNEENEKAEALFHKFIVAKARQIHESLRTDDSTFESFDDINSDEMFTEDDLNDFESDEAGEETADTEFGSEFGGEDDAAGETVGDETVVDADADAEIDDAAAEVETDLDGEATDETAEDRIADLEAKLAELTAQFEAEMGTAETEVEGDEFADDFADETAETETDIASDEDGEMADSMEDDMQDKVSESDEFDFDDISESIVSELEKVVISMTDGKEVGAGKSFNQNKTSPALQKKPNPMTDGKPVSSKGGEHAGFERETAPTVKDNKKTTNTKAKATDGQTSVSKEGDKSALINKTPGAEAQTRSPLAKR